jgi:hypothetical protein
MYISSCKIKRTLRICKGPCYSLLGLNQQLLPLLYHSYQPWHQPTCCWVISIRLFVLLITWLVVLGIKASSIYRLAPVNSRALTRSEFLLYWNCPFLSPTVTKVHLSLYLLNINTTLSTKKRNTSRQHVSQLGKLKAWSPQCNQLLDIQTPATLLSHLS